MRTLLLFLTFISLNAHAMIRLNIVDKNGGTWSIERETNQEIQEFVSNVVLAGKYGKPAHEARCDSIDPGDEKFVTKREMRDITPPIDVVIVNDSVGKDSVATGKAMKAAAVMVEFCTLKDQFVMTETDITAEIEAQKKIAADKAKAAADIDALVAKSGNLTATEIQTAIKALLRDRSAK